MLISKFTMSAPEIQEVAIDILPNISRSKDNQTEYNEIWSINRV